MTDLFSALIKMGYQTNEYWWAVMGRSFGHRNIHYFYFKSQQRNVFHHLFLTELVTGTINFQTVTEIVVEKDNCAEMRLLVN